MHREVVADHVVVRRTRRLLLVTRCVTIDEHSGIVPRIPLQELLARQLGRPAPDHDFAQHPHHSVRPKLRDQRTHRIHVEIQRPPQSLGWIHLYRLHMLIAVECRVHPAALHIQVGPQHFLLVERLVVAVLQPLVEISDLIQQVPVLERLRQNRPISVHRVRNELPVYPVVTLRRPYRESAQPRRPRIAQPSLQAQPRFLLRVRQLIQPEPRQVRPAQPLELIHRPEQDSRSRIPHDDRILGLVMLVRDLVALQNLDQRRLCRIP